MADKQPPTVVEGATTGDVEDELPTAKSAEDRKAAAALSNLDDAAADDASRNNVDQDAVHKAMKNLDGSAAGKASTATTALPVRKNVKVDAADVTLLVEQLDMTKPKATELLRSHDGDAVKALTAYITAA